MNLEKERQKKKGSKGVKPGVYKSETKSVGDPRGYVPGEAFEICYELTDEKGNTAAYREIFFNNDYNERTCEFLDYLAENNIMALKDLVGRHEEIEILYTISNNRRHTTIASRKFI